MSSRTRFFAVGLIAAFALALNACSGISVSFDNDRVEGNGREASDLRMMQPFDRVVLEGEGHVVVSRGDGHSVTVVTDDNLIELVTTQVAGSTLLIATPSGIDLEPSDEIEIRVSAPSVRGIELRGVGRFDVDSIEALTFDLDLSGVGSVDVTDLKADTVTVDMTGVGSVVMAGEADRQIIHKSGVGSYHAGSLRTIDAVLDTDGPGSATLWATGTLDIRADGIGGIEYYGNPLVSQETRGFVTARSLGEK
jgi:hypothetical protein